MKTLVAPNSDELGAFSLFKASPKKQKERLFR